MAKQSSKLKRPNQSSAQPTDPRSPQRTARSRFTPEYGVMLGLLKTHTIKAGVTQERIAERLGKSQSHVSMCLSQEREISFVDLWKWCDAIDLKFSDFARKFETAIQAHQD